jgi:hypothetical protein
LLPIEEEAEGELSFCSSESVCTFFGSEGDQDVDRCENKDGVFVAEDDEDEDDLPPLDDWYLTDSFEDRDDASALSSYRRAKSVFVLSSSPPFFILYLCFVNISTNCSPSSRVFAFDLF